MKHRILRNLFTTGTIGLTLGVSVFSQDNTPKVTSIEGLVRDIACPIQNPEAKATDFNLECAVKCARSGSPLIIQTKDDLFYIPISGKMPDTDQRPRLMPFVAKYVRATGQVFERNGTRAIVVQAVQVISPSY